LRACKHFKSSLGDETDIVQSEGHSWNAWKEVWDGDRKIESSFEVGLMYEYLLHLADNPECCKEIGWKHSDVMERLKEIAHEWRKAQGLEDP